MTIYCHRSSEVPVSNAGLCLEENFVQLGRAENRKLVSILVSQKSVCVLAPKKAGSRHRAFPCFLQDMLLHSCLIPISWNVNVLQICLLTLVCYGNLSSIFYALVRQGFVRPAGACRTCGWLTLTNVK